MKKPAVILATALSTVALAGAVGVGVASADPTPSATPSTSATPTAGPSTQATKPDKAGKANKANKGQRDLIRRAVHGEVTLGGKKHQVIDFQRGVVSAVSGTAVTVKSNDGFTATYGVNAQTKVRKAKQPAAIADVKTGDRVRVVAVKDGSTVTARRVADVTK